MSSSEEVLARAAQDGTIEDAQWSSIFGDVITRLKHNVFKEFPVPSITLPDPAPPLPSRRQLEGTAPDPNEGSRKENAPPPSSPPQSSTPSRPNEPIPIPGSISLPDGTLPPSLQATWNYVSNILNTQFAVVPPHTIQRLAELTLNPKEHHRFLHSYLNALDRVVSVSSGLNAYPSPVSEPTALGVKAGSLLNGVHPSVLSAPSPASFGSDESLGGALLTPIPWLRDGSPNDPIPRSPTNLATTILPSSVSADDSSSTPGIDTPTDSSTSTPPPDPGAMDSQPTTTVPAGITQGELLRQQQQASSPPAPVSSLTSTITSTSAPESSSDEIAEALNAAQDDSEQPHARGPEEIGMEDTGKQAHGLGSGQVLDMEAAVGRPASSRATSRRRPNRSSAEGADVAAELELELESDSGDELEDEAEQGTEAPDNLLNRPTAKLAGSAVAEGGVGKDNDGDDDMPDADVARDNTES